VEATLEVEPQHIGLLLGKVKRSLKKFTSSMEPLRKRCYVVLSNASLNTYTRKIDREEQEGGGDAGGGATAHRAAARQGIQIKQIDALI